jgi:hypothetical protein
VQAGGKGGTNCSTCSMLDSTKEAARIMVRLRRDKKARDSKRIKNILESLCGVNVANRVKRKVKIMKLTQVLFQADR